MRDTLYIPLRPWAALGGVAAGDDAQQDAQDSEHDQPQSDDEDALDDPAMRQPDRAVRLLADGTLLLVDASLDLVAVVSWSGQVRWSAGRGSGPPLRDPHSAQQLDDGQAVAGPAVLRGQIERFQAVPAG